MNNMLKVVVDGPSQIPHEVDVVYGPFQLLLAGLFNDEVVEFKSKQ